MDLAYAQLRPRSSDMRTETGQESAAVLPLAGPGRASRTAGDLPHPRRLRCFTTSSRFPGGLTAAKLPVTAIASPEVRWYGSVPRPAARVLNKIRRYAAPCPWITQYASPSLIAAVIFYGDPRAEDPRWRKSGAPDRETYAAWCARWCGMACFRMALLARDGVAPTLYELAIGGMEYGAYTDEPRPPAGLIYRPFAEYARDKHGLQADVVTDLDSARLMTELDAGRLGIVLGTSGDPAPAQPPARDRRAPSAGNRACQRAGHLPQSVRPHAGGGCRHAPHARLRPLRRPPRHRPPPLTR